MGNCVVAWRPREGQLGREEEGDDASVKVVRCSDGEEFLFPGPVMVEDLMYGFQGMAVYASKGDGDDNTPVSPEAELRPGDVYYLKTKPSSSTSSSSSSSDSEDNPADDLITNGSHGGAADGGRLRGAAHQMITSSRLPVVRVRLLMSTRDLSQLLREQHLDISPSSSLPSPLSTSPSDLIAQKLRLQLQPTSNAPDQPSPPPSAWKPSLSHIPESE